MGNTEVSFILLSGWSSLCLESMDECHHFPGNILWASSFGSGSDCYQDLQIEPKLSFPGPLGHLILSCPLYLKAENIYSFLPLLGMKPEFWKTDPP